MHLRTAPVLLVFTLPRVTVVIYNPTLRCHPEEDTFPFESGSHQGFFLVSFQGVSEMPCLVTSGLLIRDQPCRKLALLVQQQCFGGVAMEGTLPLGL